MKEVSEKDVIMNLRKYKSYIHQFNSKTFMQEMERDGVEIWVCSGGGCKSNTVCDMLNRSGIKTYSKGWIDKGCHAPKPQPSILNNDLRSIKCAIYLYSYNVDFSVASMLRRGQLPINFFKMRPYEDKRNYTLERFIEVLEKQMDVWVDPTNHPRNINFPIILLNTDFLKDVNVLSELHRVVSQMLKKEVKPFTYVEKQRETTIPISVESIIKLKEKISHFPKLHVFSH